MAQTQKFEKVVILNSSLDSDIFPNNSSTNFTNRIYPINQEQSYDAVFPMMCSVPIISAPPDPDPSIKLYRLNDRGKVMFRDWYVLSNSTSEKTITCESVGTSNTVTLDLKLKIGIRLKPRLDLSKHVFEEKQDIATFCDFEIYLELGDWQKNATQDFILVAPNDNPMMCCLKSESINNHLYWEMKRGQTLAWKIEGNFEGDGSAIADVGISPDTGINIVKKRLWKETDLKYINWSTPEIIQLLNNMNSNTNIQFYHIYFRNLKVAFPTNIWEEIEFTPNKTVADISDDNQQIYVHCNNIHLNRIANQNEPIFQDMFISKNAIETGRLTDYLSIPNHLPLNLNSQLTSQLTFELLNAVGEENDFIDLERSTIIVCKLIKKYYDFSDAKKKTYIANLLTY